MNRFLPGILLKIASGVVAVLLMLSVKFPGKATASTGVSYNLFAI